METWHATNTHVHIPNNDTCGLKLPNRSIGNNNSDAKQQKQHAATQQRTCVTTCLLCCLFPPFFCVWVCSVMWATQRENVVCLHCHAHQKQEKTGDFLGLWPDCSLLPTLVVRRSGERAFSCFPFFLLHPGRGF